MKQVRHSDDVLHELSRISAAVSVAQPFLDELPESPQRAALTHIFGEIKGAEHTAFQAMSRVRAARDSI